jgi:hypothetical protein
MFETPRARDVNTFFTRLRGVYPRVIVALLAATMVWGCDSEGDFIGSRVLEDCNQSWPVCDLVAGCVIGNESYVQGRLPGTLRVIVRLDEPSNVSVALFLKDTTGAGTQAVFTFYEAGCTARTRVEMTGDVFVKENEDLGFVARSQDLTTLGDHRVEFTSDVQARYDFKLDVTPLRLETDGGL